MPGTNEVLAEGLRISAAGLVLVFSALALLILVMKGLQVISAWTTPSPEPKLLEAHPPPALPAAEEDAGDAERFAMVASIAVAIARARRTIRDPTLGKLLERTNMPPIILREEP